MSAEIAEDAELRRSGRGVARRNGEERPPLLLRLRAQGRALWQLRAFSFSADSFGE